MAHQHALSSLIKMKKTSLNKLEVWTENLRKALDLPASKVTIRPQAPNSTDKTDTRFFFRTEQPKKH